VRLLRRPSHASIVAYLALFVAATGTATAATGGSFLLGKSNSANHVTALSNTGSGPALQLKTHSSHTPPLSVGGNSTKVSGFNADKLDGLTSAQLQRKISNVDKCTAAGSINFVHGNGTVRCGPQVYEAVVGANAVLVRGSAGVTSALYSSSAYYYKVLFPTNVRNCSYVAAMGTTGTVSAAAGFATTAQLSSDPNGVFVATYNAAGALTAESFHIIVVCPPAS
jgi:hypothetical protein